MENEKLLDSILLTLADLYEAGNRYWQPIEPSSVEEYEPLRQLLAQLRAESLIWTRPPTGNNGPYQLTAKGYSHFLPKINALRALSRIQGDT
jgi:hypothetical protein